MSDQRIWKYDLLHRYPSALIDENADGDGYVVSVVINFVTYYSAWRMSLSDAYKDLRQKLMISDQTELPMMTTTERDSLVGIVPGFPILNITTGRIEVKLGLGWVSASGSA